MTPNARVIPLTDPGPHWSQREYVACRKLDIGFAAHRHGELGQVFHYRFPDCCTSIVTLGERADRYIDHSFVPGINWLEQCSASLRGST